MFVRRKKNRSGSTSVVVADKSSGTFTELKVIGVGITEDEIRLLVKKGKEWIAHYGGQQTITFPNEESEQLKREEDAMTEHIVSNIIGTSLKSPQTIINKVYDRIGFNAVQDEELRHLVVSRICSPMSKKATVDYLRRHFKEDVSLQKIYRYLDKLYNTQQELVQEISVRHTKTLFGGNIGILFYDVTTLYFETTDKDELRESGFSTLFNGSQYEGYTMIPVVDDFVQRFNLGKDFIVIADAGLMSAKNVRLLRAGGYKYIIGARIKKESGKMLEKIITTEHRNGVFNDIRCPDGDRLIVGYSDERAKKNAYDREQGVERLRKRYTKGTLTKSDINRRGYNKFLSISSGVTVSIDEEKIKEDAIWDGLKGYRTNTDLSPEEVYEAYQNLWNVERSFRITKGTLDVRPMFHFTPRRIEAHVCICFIALKVYKELERLLKLSGCPYSVDETLRIAETIVTIEIARPKNNDIVKRTLCITEEERTISYLINTDDWLNL